MKTLKDVNELMKEWEEDPCWDLCETEGFEDYKEELRLHQEKCEDRWEQQRNAKEAGIALKANTIGVVGLYKMIKEQEKLIERQQRALIELLDGGENAKLIAYRILRGIDE